MICLQCRQCRHGRSAANWDAGNRLTDGGGLSTPKLGLFVRSRLSLRNTIQSASAGTGSALVAGDFVIRFAVPDDVPALVQMIRALAEYEKLAHLVVADERGLAAALFGERPAAEALIARKAGENGAAAGFALFFHTFSTFLGQRGLWLEDLFVYPQFRGNGLGRRLLVDLAEVARRRECGRFEWAVLDWNAPAIGFYERMGATLLREWHLVRVTGDALARFGQDSPP
jgi:GNAT superfamily N-acetyltransferase